MYKEKSRQQQLLTTLHLETQTKSALFT